MTDRLAYRVPEAAQHIGLSERAAWRLIQSGQLTAVRAGRATLVPASALERWLDEQIAQQHPVLANVKAATLTVTAREDQEHDCGTRRTRAQ